MNVGQAKISYTTRLFNELLCSCVRVSYGDKQMPCSRLTDLVDKSVASRRARRGARGSKKGRERTEGNIEYKGDIVE